MASLTSINCGMKFAFQDYDSFSFALNTDNTLTEVKRGTSYSLTIIFPSMSNSNSIKDAVFKYGGELIKSGENINTSHLIRIERYHSAVRVYKDVFFML